MSRIYEFTFKADYNSPNANLSNNQVAYRQFKKGDGFAGFILNKNNSNVGQNPLPTSTIVNEQNWMVPLSVLQKVPNASWDTFEQYNKEKKTIATSEFPPEIQQKINDIAQQNLAKNMGAVVKRNLNLAFVLGAVGAVYGFATKKNVYVWGLAGVVLGIAVTMYNNSSPIKNTDSKKTK